MIKHQRQLTLLHLATPLEFIDINVLGPLPGTRTGNRVAVFIVAPYSNQTKAIRTSKILTLYTVKVPFGKWLIPHGILILL